MLNLPITEGELTFLAKFLNCAPILLCGRIAHTAWRPLLWPVTCSWNRYKIYGVRAVICFKIDILRIFAYKNTQEEGK